MLKIHNLIRLHVQRRQMRRLFGGRCARAAVHPDI